MLLLWGCCCSVLQMHRCLNGCLHMRVKSAAYPHGRPGVLWDGGGSGSQNSISGFVRDLANDLVKGSPPLPACVSFPVYIACTLFRQSFLCVQCWMSTSSLKGCGPLHLMVDKLRDRDVHHDPGQGFACEQQTHLLFPVKNRWFFQSWLLSNIFPS